MSLLLLSLNRNTSDSYFDDNRLYVVGIRVVEDVFGGWYVEKTLTAYEKPVCLRRCFV